MTPPRFTGRTQDIRGFPELERGGRKLAEIIKAQLLALGLGDDLAFALFLFEPGGPNKNMSWITSIDRGSAILAMLEWLDHLLAGMLPVSLLSYVHQFMPADVKEMAPDLTEWQPTPERVNALPAPLRAYIHELETRCDPAGDLRTAVLLREQVTALCLALEPFATLGLAADADPQLRNATAAKAAAIAAMQVVTAARPPQPGLRTVSFLRASADAAAAAVQAVQAGESVRCAPEHWPAVRRALLETAVELEDAGEFTQAAAPIAEVQRLDLIHGVPDVS